MHIKQKNTRTVYDNPNSRSGFSLVELSIVLVILGLLVGGILGGQSLIKAAELRSTVTEIQQWQTAVNTFKGKYFSLPGDMKNATRFWDDAGTKCATLRGGGVTAALGEETCDGDGNGRIGRTQSGVETLYERFWFWQHLSLAGLIPGQYTGVRGPTYTNQHILGENAPRSKYNSGGWMILTIDNGSTERYEMNYLNAFVLGAQSTGSMTTGPLLPPEEAWNIDTKFDDGLPGQGNVVTWYWDTCTDAANNTDYDSVYALTVTSAECALSFRNSM